MAHVIQVQEQYRNISQFLSTHCTPAARRSRYRFQFHSIYMNALRAHNTKYECRLASRTKCYSVTNDHFRKAKKQHKYDMHIAHSAAHSSVGSVEFMPNCFIRLPINFHKLTAHHIYSLGRALAVRVRHTCVLIFWTKNWNAKKRMKTKTNCKKNN